MILLSFFCSFLTPITCPPPEPKFQETTTLEASNHLPGDRQSERGNSTQASAVQVSAPKNSHLNNYNLHLPLTNATSNNLLILTKQLQNFYWTFFSQALSPDSNSSRAYIHELFLENRLYSTFLNLIVFLNLSAHVLSYLDIFLIDCLLKTYFEVNYNSFIHSFIQMLMLVTLSVQ